jgi:hypothetical protein
VIWEIVPRLQCTNHSKPHNPELLMSSQYHVYKRMYVDVMSLP